MSKLTRILFLCFIFILLFTSVCIATDVKVTSEDTHNHDESDHTQEETVSDQVSIINTDLYLAANDVTVNDVINGNAFIYGNNVTITGQVYGDLFVAGSTITLEETALITGNLFALGNNINYKGKSGDVYAFTEAFTMEKNSYINRDLKLYSAQFTLNGTIQKDIYMAVGSITIPENSKSLVGGNLYYASQEELTIEEGVIDGNIEFTKMDSSSPTISEIITKYVFTFINVILYSVIIILLSTFYTPKFAEKVTYCLKRRSIISATVGILSFVIIPIISIVLLITGFLTYVGMALLAMYILMLSITISVLGISVGNYIANKLKNKTKGKVILLSIASVTVIWLLQLIPFVGTWISIFTVIFGFGLLLISFFIRKDVAELELKKSDK